MQDNCLCGLVNIRIAENDAKQRNWNSKLEHCSRAQPQDSHQEAGVLVNPSVGGTVPTDTQRACSTSVASFEVTPRMNGVFVERCIIVSKRGSLIP